MAELIKDLAPYVTALVTIVSVILGYLYNRERTKNDSERIENQKRIDDHSMRIGSFEKSLIGYEASNKELRTELDRQSQKIRKYEEERDGFEKYRDETDSKIDQLQEENKKSMITEEQYKQEKEEFVSIREFLNKQHDEDRMELARLEATIKALSTGYQAGLDAQSKAHNAELDRLNQKMIELDKIRIAEANEYKSTIEELRAENAKLVKEITELRAEVSALKVELEGYEKSGNTAVSG